MKYFLLLLLSFTANAVDIRDFGGFPNDGTNDTPALVAAMSGGGRTVILPAGEYIISKFEIPAGTALELASGAVLRDSGLLLATEQLISIRTAGVTINATGARVVANRASYTTGEFRHGVFIFGASNVVITGLESSQHGGDGFYVGGPAGSPSRDVRLFNVLASGNRRQGISVVSAVNLTVRDSVFAATNGTNPSLGIDFEPNNNNDKLENIRFQNIRTQGNAGGGISVGLSAYTAAAAPVSISILLHGSALENPAFRKSSIRPVDRINYTPFIVR